MGIGVLLMNTGTADEPTEEAVRRYLKEFLMDPAIIGAPKPIRTVLVSHICRNRPKRTVENYRTFWTPDGSPFILDSYKQKEALETELANRGYQNVRVALGMRYGNPSFKSALQELKDAGCDHIVFVPSYPQLVNVCAGTCIRRASYQLEDLESAGWKPEISVVPYFYDNPHYQNALAESVKRTWTYTPGSKLIVSFHSTLMADIDGGDPYAQQTRETAENLADALGVSRDDLVVCYQSRFDSRKWLGPFTEKTVLGLAEAGVRDICVVCPIFTCDNMETMLEINRDLRATFLEATNGKGSFTYAPALGDNPGLIAAMADEVQNALDGKFDAKNARLCGKSADSSIPGMLGARFKK